MAGGEMSGAGPVVFLEGLGRRFGRFVAVEDLSLDVAQGEVFGFLGPNGAGKSTTIRMLCGLLKPTGGTGRVAGFDISSESEKLKPHIGYMSQRFSLYPDLKASENLDFFDAIYGAGRKPDPGRKARALEQTGLLGLEDRLTASLPTGWRQRLALACAIVHSPRILFLDEPTSGVDPSGRRSFWELIYRLASGGVTIIVTTHYMDEAEYCDRLGFLSGGRLAALGTPEELRRSGGADGASGSLEQAFVRIVEGRGGQAGG
jgi:ABC-2 type transport system ATP-binding protein